MIIWRNTGHPASNRWNIILLWIKKKKWMSTSLEIRGTGFTTIEPGSLLSIVLNRDGKAFRLYEYSI